MEGSACPRLCSRLSHHTSSKKDPGGASYKHFFWWYLAARSLCTLDKYEALAWQEAAQHNIQISFNTLMLNEPGEAALALAADLAQFAAAVASLENCSVRCSACGNALRSYPASQR